MQTYECVNNWAERKKKQLDSAQNWQETNNNWIKLPKNPRRNYFHLETTLKLNWITKKNEKEMSTAEYKLTTSEEHCLESVHKWIENTNNWLT